MYAIGAVICHQIPERSFHLSGVQLPVCARCLGIYAGAAAGAVAGFSLARRGTWRRAAAWRPTLVAASPTVITVMAEWTGVWLPSNWARAAAGAPLGFMV